MAEVYKIIGKDVVNITKKGNQKGFHDFKFDVELEKDGFIILNYGCLGPVDQIRLRPIRYNVENPEPCKYINFD